MTKEQASSVYIQGKLRDHQEYPLLDEHRRKQLITCDLYDLEQAFEDGWEEGRHLLLDNAIQYIKEHINEYLINVSTEEKFKVIIGGKLWKNLKKAMEEQ